MTDDERAEARAARAALLTQQQRDAVELLIVGNDRWAANLGAFADAMAEVLLPTLELIVLKDGAQLPWAIALLQSIRDAVLAAADTTTATTRH
jgi:hypothetical protein